LTVVLVLEIVKSKLLAVYTDIHKELTASTIVTCYRGSDPATNDPGAVLTLISFFVRHVGGPHCMQIRVFGVEKLVGNSKMSLTIF